MKTSLEDFLLDHYSQEAIDSLELITGNGSSRGYYRFSHLGKEAILTVNDNVEENETFFYFLDLLQQCTNQVPSLDFISDNREFYVQEDLGPTTLMNVLENNRSLAKEYYFALLPELIKCQFHLGETVDFSKTFSYPQLDDTMVLRDLFQFKFYFLNVLDVHYHQGKLIKDFKKLASHFNQMQPQGFVFRDFQSRNIMIQNKQPYFIDFQGGLQGVILYDLVSLIWQAKANFTAEEKKSFYIFYRDELKKKLPSITNHEIEEAYQYCVVIRLLQVLGAYGLRGLIERKLHFMESISFGLKNLNEIIDLPLLNKYPELKQVITQLINPKINEQINTKING